MAGLDASPDELAHSWRVKRLSHNLFQAEIIQSCTQIDFAQIACHCSETYGRHHVFNDFSLVDGMGVVQNFRTNKVVCPQVLILWLGNFHVINVTKISRKLNVLEVAGQYRNQQPHLGVDSLSTPSTIVVPRWSTKKCKRGF